MKSKKFMIVMLAVVVVALIAIVSISLHLPAQKPPVSPEAEVPSKTSQTPVKLAKKQPSSARASAHLPASSSPQPADEDESSPSLADDSTYLPLKALEQVEFEVNWDEASNHPQLDDTLLSDSQIDSIGTSPVPVLLPDEHKLLQAAFILTGPSWYTATMNEDDLTVMVSGASMVAMVPDSQNAEPPELGEHVTSLTRVDGIVEVSFKAFGIYYDVTVECFDPLNDPRCTEDNYVLELVDGLKRAKGPNE